MDWQEGLLAKADISVWWMCARAGIVFFAGLVMIRMAHKRVLGRWSAPDFVIAVVIGSNLSRAITGNAPLLGVLAATTVLIALHSLVSDAAARWNPLGPLLKGSPAEIVRDGEADHRAMRRHAIGAHDLEEALRLHGVDDIAQVRAAYVERNGDISVLKR